jgi:hypothetical protein
MSLVESDLMSRLESNNDPTYSSDLQLPLQGNDSGDLVRFSSSYPVQDKNN